MDAKMCSHSKLTRQGSADRDYLPARRPRQAQLSCAMSRSRSTLAGLDYSFGGPPRRSSAVLRMVSAISGLLLDNIWKSTA